MGILSGVDANQNLTGRYVNGSSLAYLIELAKDYGAEVGSGGEIEWRRGKIEVNAFSQSYDVQSIIGDGEHCGSDIEIKRVHHHRPAAVARVYDPFSMTGMSYSNIFNEMGFAGYSPATQFLMTPIFEDLLRVQAIEFNDTVRKSGYSFEIVNNKLKIFPIPTYDYNLYIDYILTADRSGAVVKDYKDAGGNPYKEVGDFSNAPYGLMEYNAINEPGRQWIRKYFLALCKESLGLIRQKYQSLPIPGAEVTLDGGELRSEAQTEKEQLITLLRENLEASGRQHQMEMEAQQTEFTTTGLKGVPLFIYIG